MLIWFEHRSSAKVTVEIASVTFGVAPAVDDSQYHIPTCERNGNRQAFYSCQKRLKTPHTKKILKLCMDIFVRNQITRYQLKCYHPHIK